jgi:hypothetical protein
MEIFADALSYIAGYGLKAYLITQDIRQIVDAYGQNESIVSNCHIRIASAPNQYETAELLSKISRTRRLIDGETHRRIFTWVLERLARGGLIQGKTIGVDSTTLEANAAMKSIVRRDTGENYTGYLKRLAEAEGIDAKDAAALRRMDRKRARKRGRATS